MNKQLKVFVLGFSLLLTSPGIFAREQNSNTQKQKLNQQQEKANLLARQIVQAYGGLENLKSFNQKGFKANGILEQISSISGSSNKLDCQLIAKGLKQHLESNFMGQTVITCFDGKSCWTQQGNHAMPTDKITSQRILEDQLHGLLLLEEILDPGRKTRLAEPRKLRGKKCPVLLVTADDGKDSTLYIDPKTFLVLRTEYTGTDTEQGVNCVKAYEYLDYREVEKSKAPFRIIEYSDAKKVSDFQVQKISTGLELPDKLFELPTQETPPRLRSGPVIIPFELVANEIIVDAKVNGEKTLRFLIDTGATQSIIDTDIAKSLGVRNSGDFNITTGSGAMKMQFMTLNSIRIGDLTMNDISVAVAPLKNFAANLRIKPAGLIGANLLKRFQLTIDYPQRQLELRAPDTKLDQNKGVMVKTKPSLGVSGLAVEGILDDKLALTFLLDSGAAYNHVSEHLVTEVLTKTPILSVGSIKGLDGKIVKTGAVKFNSLRIGDLVVNKPIFSIAPSNKKNNPGLISGGNLAIIGNPLLSRYRVTIDYANQQILFEKSKFKTEEEKILSRLDIIKQDYYQEENIARALSRLKKLKDFALSRKQYGAAGQLLSEFTYLASTTKKLSSDQINKSFTKAIQLAMLSKNEDIQARIMAKWAQYFLINKPPQYLDNASSLVSRAINTAPTQSSPYAVAGLMLLDSSDNEKIKKGQKNEKTPKAESLLDQSLMSDPSDWLALWTKYDLAKQTGKKKDMSTITQLLRKYYPEAKRVQSLKSK